MSSANITSRIEENADRLVLSNGIVSRTIRKRPFVGTVSLMRHDTGHEFIRAVESEAKLVIDGKEIWLGGAQDAPDRAFLADEWLPKMASDARSLPLIRTKVVPIEAPIPYTPRKGVAWPPKGKAVVLTFSSDSIDADVRYEVYDGIPVLSKCVIVTNRTGGPISVDRLTSERLAIVEGESVVEQPKTWRLPPMTVYTSMSFGGKYDSAVNWELDPAYSTQVNYELKTPCVLDVRPPRGPGVLLQPGQSIRSIKSYLVLHGNDSREEQSAERRKFFRVMTPWVLDNPLILHIRSNDDVEIRAAIEQAAECGFEMAIMSFGSGLDMEDISSKNIARFKALREYASSRRVRFGGYSLLASRRIDDENDVINPGTGRTGGAIFDNSPCLCSKWGIEYFARIKRFISETGFEVLEHDGSYPGDVCASTKHPGHIGLEDSQWKQHEIITDFYRWCRERNVYLNVPDTYFLAGSNKTAMGYRETNWSLPRELQHVHARQNMYDGTWDKTPSMGWMFVPLVEYQGGGVAATIEPLREHLADYELHLANTFAFGVQATWRGTRLYDSPETKEMVMRMVKWYKQYRALLESDAIHLRRADGRRIDYVFHIQSEPRPNAILIAFNPTAQLLEETIPVPLPIAVFGSTCSVRERESNKRSLPIGMDGVPIHIRVPARGWTYFTFSRP